MGGDSRGPGGVGCDTGAQGGQGGGLVPQLVARLVQGEGGLRVPGVPLQGLGWGQARRAVVSPKNQIPSYQSRAL